MTIFIVASKNPDTKLASRIESSYPFDYLELADNQWLISATGSAKEVSEVLGLEKGSGFKSTIVFATSGYFGLHSTDTWDWIRSRLEEK